MKIRPKLGPPTVLDYESPNEKPSTDYTGLLIVAMLTPVFVFFAFLDKADMGLSTCIVLGMVMLAIRLRWQLRKYIWFWATIILILVFHVPLLLFVRWPQGKLPTLAYTLPIGVADFFVILGGLGLAEKLFSKDSSS